MGLFAFVEKGGQQPRVAIVVDNELAPQYAENHRGCHMEGLEDTRRPEGRLIAHYQEQDAEMMPTASPAVKEHLCQRSKATPEWASCTTIDKIGYLLLLCFAPHIEPCATPEKAVMDGHNLKCNAKPHQERILGFAMA